MFLESSLLSPGLPGRESRASMPVGATQAESKYEAACLHAFFGDSLTFYKAWPKPVVIISDGAYGVLGFEGDTSGPAGLQEWYEPHIKAWAKYASPQTTLWFWNSEIGWATVHPILEKYGWKYENANIWNKGKAHIAGNVNTATIRRFPVVTEICVQYSYKASIDGQTLGDWLIAEWKRSGLKMRQANEACDVSDAATRKYLTRDHLWYFPPPEMFAKLAAYANRYGRPDGRPYFSLDGKEPMGQAEWAAMRTKFRCPYGWTNVWERGPVSGSARCKTRGATAHLNQKPLDLMKIIIEAASDKGDVIWEPFGGLFSGCLAARRLGRDAYGAEINPDYFGAALSRIKTETANYSLVDA